VKVPPGFLTQAVSFQRISTMARPLILILHWLPDGELARWLKEFPQFEFVEGNQSDQGDQLLAEATITYGLPVVNLLREARRLRWIQLASAGVPANLCGPAQTQGIRVTNLAGLYGPTIAEHTLALMLVLGRNLHLVQKNQGEKRWDRSVAGTMRDLHGKTLAVVGLGNIGQNIARLSKALGMRVIGCRRRVAATPYVDMVYGPGEIQTMLSQADFVAVAAPLVPTTDGLLGPAEFQSLPRGAIYINVSRGGIAQERALLDALQSGKLAAAGLDVFAVEPLSPDHPFWSMPNVLISPHYSGETVNNSNLPAQRFTRNLHSWMENLALEGQVDLQWGY
jgi:phosphoglycerate dehydrogenase-like enzyme